MFDPPIFINCRDRLTDLQNLVDWLANAGHERIIMLDNDSSYPPLLEYYEQTPFDVEYLGANLGSRAIWRSDKVPTEEFFVYTDPDILPIEECPRNAVSYLHVLLEQFPQFPKAGLGLYLEDVPQFQSEGWERSLMAPNRQVAEGVFDSLVDTSFALYRPRTTHALYALRTGMPYMCRHIPWYHLSTPTEEERYYLEHCIKGPLGSSWADGRQ